MISEDRPEISCNSEHNDWIRCRRAEAPQVPTPPQEPTATANDHQNRQAQAMSQLDDGDHLTDNAEESGQNSEAENSRCLTMKRKRTSSESA